MDKKTIEDAHAQMLRSSPAYFGAKMLVGPSAAPYNGKFMIGRHHLLWDKLATNPRKVCVLASRNCGKSFFFLLLFLCFLPATNLAS